MASDTVRANWAEPRLRPVPRIPSVAVAVRLNGALEDSTTPAT